MRRFLHRNKWATTLVAALFLLATSGMSVSRMTCLHSGHSVLSIGAVADCCPDRDKGDQATVSATCCAFSIAKSDVQDYLPNTLSIALAVPVLPEHAWLITPVALAVTPTAWLSSRPPPLSGQDRLLENGVQRV